MTTMHIDQIERDIAQAARATGVEIGVLDAGKTAASKIAAIELALAAAEQRADDDVRRAPGDPAALRARARVARAIRDVATLRHVQSSYGKQQAKALTVAKSRLALAEADLAIAEMRPHLTEDEARTLDEIAAEARRALAVAARNVDREGTFALADNAVALAEADLDHALAPIRAVPPVDDDRRRRPFPPRGAGGTAGARGVLPPSPLRRRLPGLPRSVAPSRRSLELAERLPLPEQPTRDRRPDAFLHGAPGGAHLTLLHAKPPPVVLLLTTPYDVWLNRSHRGDGRRGKEAGT